jgi:hypothetical protein
MADMKENGVRMLKRHFREEGACFGRSQQKLSLPQLPISPHSFASPPSLRSLSISVALATVALGPASGAGAWIGTVGRVAFTDDVFPLLRKSVIHILLRENFSLDCY